MALLAHFSRIGGSFLIVVIAYWLYALVAVPLIEPEAPEHLSNIVTDEQIELARIMQLQQVRDLGMWFSPDDWEIKEAKSNMTLETPQGKLLLRRYHNLPDGSVKIEPCSMIFVPEGTLESEQDRKRRAIVLRSPEGAILEFDEPFDPKKGKIGKLVGGQLLGNVDIHSDQRSPGPEDDLRINTRDVVLKENVVSTPHPLVFRLGPNWGKGRRLRMTLASKGKGQIDTSPAKEGGPNVGGVTWFELTEEVELQIVPGQADMFPGRARGVAPPTTAANAAPQNKPPVPVEVKCRGPFQFDLQKYVATFRDQVDVLRINPAGPSDQLTCELLTLFFETKAPAQPSTNKPTIAGKQAASAKQADAAKQASAGKKDASAKKEGGTLEPSRMVADGDPVVLRAPTNGVDARGQQLEYDLKSGRAKLRSKDRVDFRQGRNEIHAPMLEYQPDKEGSLGQFLAPGPGWLRGTRPDDADAREIQASWTKRLHFRPHENNQVLSVEGDAHVQVAGMGNLDAEEIHLWLREAPAADKPLPNATGNRRPQLVADRMLARGHVRIDSTQLTGAVGQLEVWFEHAPERPKPPARNALGPTPAAAIQSHVARVPATVLANVMAPSEGILPAGDLPGGNLPGTSQQRFHIIGELLRMRVTMRGQAAEVDEVVVERDVRFVETVTTRPGEKPLAMTGDQLHMLQPTPGAAQVTVTGRPAHVEARGLTLDGGAIHLDRAKNHLWVDSRGVMTLPVNQDQGFLAGGPQGQASQVLPFAGLTGAPGNDSRQGGAPTGPPRILEISWSGRMDFDGLTSVFDRDVVCRLDEQLLRTDSLEVTLTKRMKFDAGPNGERPEVDLLKCRNGVFMENRTLEAGRVISMDRMQLRDLIINQRSGDIAGTGPGWVTSARFGAQPGMTPPAGTRLESTSPADTDQLNYLGVQFQRELTGNLRRREMNFEDRVRSVYGPIPHWQATLDPDKPDELGQRGMVMTCDRLTVADMGADAAGRRLYEMLAVGNALVENATFTARASRLTYAQGKDLMVLEGDGRNEARLFRQMRPGEPSSELAARKILYWRMSNRVDVDGAKVLNLSEIKAGAPDSQ